MKKIRSAAVVKLIVAGMASARRSCAAGTVAGLLAVAEAGDRLEGLPPAFSTVSDRRFLGVRGEMADIHVLDHPPAKRATTRPSIMDAPVRAGVAQPTIFRQDPTCVVTRSSVRPPHQPPPRQP